MNFRLMKFGWSLPGLFFSGVTIYVLSYVIFSMNGAYYPVGGASGTKWFEWDTFYPTFGRNSKYIAWIYAPCYWIDVNYVHKFKDKAGKPL